MNVTKKEEVRFYKHMGYLCCTPPYGMVITQMRSTGGGAESSKYNRGGNKMSKFVKKPYDDKIMELKKQNLAYDEIAVELDISWNMVKNRLRRLRIQGLI